MDFLPLWIALAIVMVASILIDFFGHKDKHEMSIKESALWSVLWIFMSMVLASFIYVYYGAALASQFLSGYVMEKALSIDNLMVFVAIFSFFGITSGAVKHKVLMWGILGALVFRGIFVAAGSALFHLHWAIQVLFGLIVIWSAKGVLGDDDEEVDYDKTWFVKLIRKFYGVDAADKSGAFFVKYKGETFVTMTFLAMVTIELSDVLFSFDSVPAVIGVTNEAVITYGCMMCAVLGLRALFFVLDGLMKHLTRLPMFVAAILVFVGAKLIAAPFGYEVDSNVSLFIILSLMAGGVIASFVAPVKGIELN
ncbi:membrane protein [Aeromonas phage BUCT695]|uniref:membrane protein n=1 Tax=Aeromonas phage BUCT695 TaxID=2908630 RepID=UPI00232905CA|nr:membrane protein [Aeromonas phage BUCT695]UIW10488.1 integral membrane protein [Aeromonas phage BUCT695]